MIRKRWTRTGNILISSCKWSIEVIITQPVAMRRAELWTVLSFWTRDDEALENQMRVAYIKMDQMRDKDGFPLLTPVGTSKGLEDVDMGWSLSDLNCHGLGKWLPVCSVSFQEVATREMFRVTWGWVLDCANWVVKRVMVNFETDMINSSCSQ